MHTIYMYTNNVTGKSYIGLTGNLEQRQKGHKNPSSNCLAFRNAVQKYGFNSFDRKVLAEGLMLDQANEMEVTFIRQFDTRVPNGYNLRSGGSAGYMHAEETKRKISLTKQRQHRKLTEEQKQYLSKVAKARGPKSEETKRRMSDAQRGHACSDETKNKLSVLNKDKVLSEETRQKISRSKKGIQKSQETKQKMSVAKRGKPGHPRSEETRAKMSLAHKNWWMQHRSNAET